MSQEKETSLDVFSESFQLAMIGYCFKDNIDFAKKCFRLIPPQWLTCQIEQRDLYDQLAKFHKQHQALPASKIELFEQSHFKTLDFTQRKAYDTAYTLCEMAKGQFTLSNIRSQLTDFIKLAKTKEALMASYQKVAKNRVSDGITILNQYSEEIKQLSFESTNLYELQINHPVELFVQDKAIAYISTGSKNLDLITEGGFQRSEQTLILAPSNVGKTQACVTITKNTILQGNRDNFVLLLSHEGNTAKVKRQLIASLLRTGSNTIKAIIQEKTEPGVFKSPAQLQQEKRDIIANIEKANQFIDERVILLDYVSGNMSVDHVIDIIEEKMQACLDRNGKYFDMVIDDSPNLLSLSNDRRQGWETLPLIYRKFNYIATKYKSAVITTHQQNRDGHKASRNAEGKNAGMESAQAAFGINQEAAVVLTLNQSEEYKQHRLMNIHLAKSRETDMNQGLITKTNLAAGLMWDDTLPSFIQSNSNKLSIGDALMEIENIANKMKKVDNPKPS